MSNYEDDDDTLDTTTRHMIIGGVLGFVLILVTLCVISPWID